MSSPTSDRSRRFRLSPLTRQVLLYVLFMLPAVSYLAGAFSGDLGPNPFKTCLHEFGRYAFRFLLVSLMVSPLKRFLKIDLMVYRRPLGLLAFSYAALHVTLYFCWARGFDIQRIWKDFLTRPFLTFGLIAFSILAVLAATSTRKSIIRLGKKWARLHRLVYVAMVLACIHYAIAFKQWYMEPFVYAAVAACVLGLRFVPKAGFKRS